MTVRQDTAENDPIVVQVLSQLGRLFRKEVDLARVETVSKIRQAGMAIAFLVFAAIATVVGLNILAAALVTALVELLTISEGWSAVIVGGATILIATALAMKALHDLKLENLTPDRTAAHVRKDAQLLKEKLHG